ncbi:hypothetical protein [uncultured Parasutterella sp.]|uniref:hypothetical protein n=1 Tax=uncultured Parasutterella sp. TaxID=1263098 RepID=UPI00272B5084|nr:hypothetical protein [uncultured Parasutterella sp.]
MVMLLLIFSNSSKERQQTFEIVSKGRRFAAMSFLAQDNLTSLLPSSIPIALPLATERKFIQTISILKEAQAFT